MRFLDTVSGLTVCLRVSAASRWRYHAWPVGVLPTLNQQHLHAHANCQWREEETWKWTPKRSLWHRKAKKGGKTRDAKKEKLVREKQSGRIKPTDQVCGHVTAVVEANSAAKAMVHNTVQLRGAATRRPTMLWSDPMYCICTCISISRII